MSSARVPGSTASVSSRETPRETPSFDSLDILDLNALHNDADMNDFASSNHFMELPMEEDASYVNFENTGLAVTSVLDVTSDSADHPECDDLGLRDMDHVLRHVSASAYADPLPPEFYGSNERRRQRNLRSRRRRSKKKSKRTPFHRKSSFSFTKSLPSVDTSKVVPSDPPSADPEEFLNQLYSLDFLLHETKQSRSAFYTTLSSRDVETSLLTDRVHMDGGAQTTTTADKTLLHHYHLYDSSVTVPALRVADNHVHYPVGAGYLKVPSTDTDGFNLVACFHTPTLPATIMSPDRVGKSNGCRGYSTLSLFNADLATQCHLRLHHCLRSAQDITFPLTAIRGLLYTDPVSRPTATEHAAPRPKVAVTICTGTPADIHAVNTDDTNMASTPHDDSTSSDVDPPCSCCSPSATSAPAESLGLDTDLASSEAKLFCCETNTDSESLPHVPKVSFHLDTDELPPHTSTNPSSAPSSSHGPTSSPLGVPLSSGPFPTPMGAPLAIDEPLPLHIHVLN